MLGFPDRFSLYIYLSSSFVAVGVENDICSGLIFLYVTVPNRFVHGSFSRYTDESTHALE
jgi:hypothetical protein